MKKVIGLVLVCGFAVAFLACDGGKKEAAAKAKADSTRRADSMAVVAAAEAKAKAIADSTAMANAAKAKADSIANASKGKKKK